MSANSTIEREIARYALQFEGEQVEYGISENIFRFRAALASLSGQIDLSLIQGLLIENESGGDTWVAINDSQDNSVVVKSIISVEGQEATRLIESACDIKFQSSGRKTLFLYQPIINDIDDANDPGTRILAALRRHFSGQRIHVVIDFGTDKDDQTFIEYFFSDFELLELSMIDHRLAVGQWGESKGSQGKTFTFGVSYR